MESVRDRQRESMTVKQCGRKRELQAILATGQGEGEDGRKGEQEKRSVAGKGNGKRFERQAKGGNGRPWETGDKECDRKGKWQAI